MEDDQLCSDDEVDELERRNAFLQFNEIRRLAALDFANPGCVVIDVEMAKRLHVFATTDIFSFAGQLRSGYVGIGGTTHRPPPADEVPGYLDEMFKYVVDHWDASPVHLCSYLLWRCNWIHPFRNGNGRTTRGLAYLAFLLRLRYEPGGSPSFIEMIGDDKSLYYSSLDDADAAWRDGRIDVSSMEKKASELLSKQLVKTLAEAGVKLPPRK